MKSSTLEKFGAIVIVPNTLEIEYLILFKEILFPREGLEHFV